MTPGDGDLRVLLVRLGACEGARCWLGHPGDESCHLCRDGRAAPPYLRASDAWAECPRGDWLLWLAARAGVDRKLVVRAACDCARTALHLVQPSEDRPRLAIEAAEDWCEGAASVEEVRDAAAADRAAAAAHAAADAADGEDARAAWKEAHRRCADLARARVPLEVFRTALLAKAHLL